MSTRNRVLGLVFLVLLALTLVIEKPWQGDAHARTLATVRPLLPELRQDVEIGRVRITPALGGEAVQVEKVLDRGRPRWVVPEAFDHPADVIKLGRLIESLRALETRNLESVQADSHATYKLREGEAIGIEVWSDEGQLLAHVLIGGLRGQDVLDGGEPIVQFYVRRAEDNEVYRSNAVYLPPEDPVRWCDTRFLTAVGEEQIRFLQRTDHIGRESWRIVLDPEVQVEAISDSEREVEASGRWRMVMPEPGLVPDFAGDSWVFTMLGLEAADVIGFANTPEGEQRFGELQNTFEVGLEEGSFRIDLGAVLANNRRAARVHGLPHLYALEDFEVEQLTQSVADMRMVE
ncbi:MAG: hypothetical protein CMJ94_01145 [Planctomycetes bacterium]|mgnify:CR=1 FL=1|nr:hypothetical protein [Planctomycetota bacterium]